jgi:hypothetical protein
MWMGDTLWYNDDHSMLNVSRALDLAVIFLVMVMIKIVDRVVRPA